MRQVTAARSERRKLRWTDQGTHCTTRGDRCEATKWNDSYRIRKKAKSRVTCCACARVSRRPRTWLRIGTALHAVPLQSASATCHTVGRHGSGVPSERAKTKMSKTPCERTKEVRGSQKGWKQKNSGAALAFSH